MAGDQTLDLYDFLIIVHSIPPSHSASPFTKGLKSAPRLGIEP
jgi:hypothetical protein